MSKVKNILSKLRPDRTDSKQAKTVERIAAIGHSSDAVGWRPVPYTIPDRFNQFISHLDSDIESFISQGNPDRYNALYFEGTVDAEVKLALKETLEKVDAMGGQKVNKGNALFPRLDANVEIEYIKSLMGGNK